MDTPAQNWSRSASLRKQVTGELALVPRGSQPTTSKRPPLHWSKSAHDSPTTVTPLAPGPPGLRNADPMRSCGRLARWRRTARSMCSPLGRSQSNGTDSFPHCNWSSSANGGSQPVHAMPAASGAAGSGDGPACAVFTAPTAVIATAHTATTTDRMIARGRGLPLAPLLAITHHPSAGRAPRDRLPSHLDVPADTPTLLTALLVAERLRRATGVGARAASARAQAIPVLRRFRQDADLKVLAADTPISLATGYRYLHEGIDVLAAQAPDLHQVLERGKAGGWTHVTLEGTLRA